MKTNWERLTYEQLENCIVAACDASDQYKRARDIAAAAINSLPPELFDAAERLAAIKRILDNAYDSSHMHYDVQAVNVAHRIASGGEMPCLTTTGETK